MYFQEYYGKENDRKITKLVANQVMKEIKKLYHQDYKIKKNIAKDALI